MKTNWINNNDVFTATLPNGNELRIEPRGDRFSAIVNDTLVATRTTVDRAKNSARWFGMDADRVKTVNPRAERAQKAAEPKFSVEIGSLATTFVNADHIKTASRTLGRIEMVTIEGTRAEMFTYAEILKMKAIELTSADHVRPADAKKALRAAADKILTTLK